MALPANVDLVTVTGTYVYVDGTPATGKVTFTPSLSSWIQDAGAPATLLPRTITATLDIAGKISVPLPATDDPDLAPNGWTYDVVEDFGNGLTRKYAIGVPTSAGTIDLATVAPVTPVSGGSKVVTRVNGKVPDINGAVVLTPSDIGALPATYTPPAAPVQSVSGKTGIVLLTAADVGALPVDYPVVQSVNGKTGSAISIGPAEIGALPSSTTAADIGAAGQAETEAALEGKADAKTFDRFGSNLLIGDPSGSPTQAQTEASIATMASQFGPRPMLLVFHIAYDGATLKIVQHGYGATTHSEAKVDAAVAALAAHNFPIYGIKVHQGGITSGQTTAQFWTDYTALINQLAAKYAPRTDTKYFFVTNEFESATGNSANATALNGLVSAVRGQGYKAGMCFNSLAEASRCVVTDLDGTGVNVYPSVSTNGLNTTWQQVAAAWDGYGVTEYFRYLKRTYPGRDCFVTETGSTDKAYALEYTPDWNVAGQPDNAGAIVGRYWEGTLRYLAEDGGDPVDALFAWDQGLFDPYQFPYSLDIVKHYAKAATL